MKNWDFFIDRLKTWYKPERRVLPWKDIDDPYLIWVSEVFLQQTQADRVIEFFLRFSAKFPTLEKLAKTNFEVALPYFKGLGYYRRLRMMIETAKIVVEKHQGKFPSEVEELKKLPGVGEYTARAIASFAFKQLVIAPDTNVKRILERFFGRPLKDLTEFDKNFPKGFNLNQVLMDFGGQVCLARNPRCGDCPLSKKCHFAKNSKLKVQNSKQIPSSKFKAPRNYQKVVVGILIQDKRVLVSRRKADQSYPGLLEFPGGRVELGEDERKALQREFREEVGIQISVRPSFERLFQHQKKRVLSFHRCRILTGTPQSMEDQEVFWVEQYKLNPKEFLPANKKIIEQLKKSRL